MAIVQPEEMDFSKKKFSMIICGSPGVGKTTLALSAPNPVLIDFDQGISRVRAAHRKTAILSDTYEEVLQDMQTEAVKQAETIIIDTGGSFITYLQDWAMRSNPTANKQKNSNTISQKGFGAVKAEFVSFTNRLTYTMDKHVIYIFHTVEEKDGDTVKQRLMCEGSARNIVWQPCDLGCYIQMLGEKRYMGFTPTEQYFAKGCYGIAGLREIPELSEDRPNDLLTRLFSEARANISKESSEMAVPRKMYAAAMEQGRKLADSIQDPDSATAALSAAKGIEHALTSEREIRALLASRIKRLGYSWDEKGKRYVQG